MKRLIGLIASGGAVVKAIENFFRMNKVSLKKKILKVISGMRLAALATIKDKKPWVRFIVS